MGSLCDWLVRVRLRLVVRGAFLALAMAIVVLSLVNLHWLKSRTYANYRQSLQHRLALFQQQLLHPYGQLALNNPQTAGMQGHALRPFLIPYGALTVTDPRKAHDEAELAGCLLQFGATSVCSSVSRDRTSGAYIYITGSFLSHGLQADSRLPIAQATRMELNVQVRGRSQGWLAPLQAAPVAGRSRRDGVESRLEPRGALLNITGYRVGPAVRPGRDDKEFKGYAIEDPTCRRADGAIEDAPADARCLRESIYALRMPVDMYRDDALDARLPWPPADLPQVRIGLRILGPTGGLDEAVLFDSDTRAGRPAFTLEDLAASLQPGERLEIRERTAPQHPPLLSVTAPGLRSEKLAARLVRALPVGVAAMGDHRVVTTRRGDFVVQLQGNADVIDAGLADFAGRLAMLAATMLAAIGLAWVTIEYGMVRRVSRLTARAATLSRTVRSDDSGMQIQVDLSDMRGADEIGVLAAGLDDLLGKVNADLSRQSIHLERDRRNWELIGHELLNPLANLQALHASDNDPSKEHIARMHAAVQLIYGSASPGDAMSSAEAEVESFDLVTFLKKVARNSPAGIGVQSVSYAGPEQEVLVRADRGKLADALEHILTNANRYRVAGSTIVMSLDTSCGAPAIGIRNQGPHIPDSLINHVFEYGVSDSGGGVGLFVAQSYLNKMDGFISVRNEVDGVTFLITLPAYDPLTRAMDDRATDAGSAFRQIERQMADMPLRAPQ